MNTFGRIACVALAAATLSACQTDSRTQVLGTTQSAVALRAMQSRKFATNDREKMLRAVMATLQDLSFVVDKADATLGTISATKLSGYNLRMTVSVRAQGETEMIVRANAQYNITAVESPEPYQQFFAALEKSLFLQAQSVD